MPKRKSCEDTSPKAKAPRSAKPAQKPPPKRKSPVSKASDGQSNKKPKREAQPVQRFLAGPAPSPSAAHAEVRERSCGGDQAAGKMTAASASKAPKAPSPAAARSPKSPKAAGSTAAPAAKAKSPKAPSPKAPSPAVARSPKSPKAEKAVHSPSAYNLFFKAKLAKIKAAEPTIEHKMAFGQAVAGWKVASAEEKASFEAEAEAEAAKAAAKAAKAAKAAATRARKAKSPKAPNAGDSVASSTSHTYVVEVKQPETAGSVAASASTSGAAPEWSDAQKQAIEKSIELEQEYLAAAQKSVEWAEKKGLAPPLLVMYAGADPVCWSPDPKRLGKEKDFPELLDLTNPHIHPEIDPLECRVYTPAHLEQGIEKAREEMQRRKEAGEPVRLLVVEEVLNVFKLATPFECTCGRAEEHELQRHPEVGIYVGTSDCPFGGTTTLKPKVRAEVCAAIAKLTEAMAAFEELCNDFKCGLLFTGLPNHSGDAPWFRRGQYYALNEGAEMWRGVEPGKAEDGCCLWIY
jgi:hypothetical protein